MQIITFNSHLIPESDDSFDIGSAANKIRDLYVSDKGGRNSKMGKYLGQGMTFKEAKKTKMPNDTIEGADLALEIGSKVKHDFDVKQLPLMTSVIDAICNEKPLNIKWNYFK